MMSSQPIRDIFQLVLYVATCGYKLSITEEQTFDNTHVRLSESWRAFFLHFCTFLRPIDESVQLFSAVLSLWIYPCLLALKIHTGQSMLNLLTAVISLSPSSWKITPPWAASSSGWPTLPFRSWPMHIWRRKRWRPTILPPSHIRRLSSSSWPLHTTLQPR